MTRAAALLLTAACLFVPSSASKRLALEERIALLERREAAMIEEAKLCVSEREHLLVVAGYEPKYGEGIRVTISDAPRSLLESIPADEDLNMYIVHDTDIIRLCALLLSAGAGAVSINGVAIDPMMGIKCAGPVIRVRGHEVSAPFTVDAIGDGHSLYDAVSSSGLLREWESFGLIFELSREETLHVPGLERIAIRYALAGEE